MPVKTAKKASKVKKKVTVSKKPRAPSIKKQISAKILEVCVNSNNELMVYELTNSYAMIIKCIHVTTFHTLNSTSFCPRDTYSRKEFFSAFYIIFEPKGNALSPDLFIPAFHIKTPKQAELAILSYDGETIPE